MSDANTIEPSMNSKLVDLIDTDSLLIINSIENSHLPAMISYAIKLLDKDKLFNDYFKSKPAGQVASEKTSEATTSSANPTNTSTTSDTSNNSTEGNKVKKNIGWDT